MSNSILNVRKPPLHTLRGVNLQIKEGDTVILDGRTFKIGKKSFSRFKHNQRRWVSPQALRVLKKHMKWPSWLPLP